MTALVGIVMGSDSDYETLSGAESVLKEFGVAHEVEVVSAHRTPERMYDYAKTAASRGLKVIIAGAGGAAYLPGMISSLMQGEYERPPGGREGVSCRPARDPGQRLRSPGWRTPGRC